MDGNKKKGVVGPMGQFEIHSLFETQFKDGMSGADVFVFSNYSGRFRNWIK